MKTYQSVEIKLITLQAQDVVTVSGFQGKDDYFSTPSSNTNFAE